MSHRCVFFVSSVDTFAAQCLLCAQPMSGSIRVCVKLRSFGPIRNATEFSLGTCQSHSSDVNLRISDGSRAVTKTQTGGESNGSSEEGREQEGDAAQEG